MPNSISLSSAIEKAKLSSDVPYLVLLEVDVTNPTTKAVVQTLYLTSNTENFTFKGNAYSAIPFSIDLKQEAGRPASLTITFQDTEGVLRDQVDAYFGGIGFGVRLLVVRGVVGVTDPDLYESFEITDASLNDYAIEFTLGTPSLLTLTFPPRRFSLSCGVRYKSTACGYVGALATCDRTLDGANGCRFHNNTIRYGGFRGIINQ